MQMLFLPLLTDMLLLQNIKIIWHLIMVHWIPCLSPTLYSQGQQQVLAKLMPDDLRIRRAEELQQNFLKILIGRFSLREEILATDRAKIFPSNPIHCVSPACHYFVFTLRRILI